MATVNIFASVDVNGLIEEYKDKLTEYYGVDVTSKYMSEDLERVLIQIKDGQKRLYKIGYWDSSVLPSYTRLISSKNSTIGYKVTSNDYSWINQSKGELQLNNIYNLMISASNGDKIIWWGHSIRANSHIQVIISNIDKPGSSTTPPSEFKNVTRKNIQFYYASAAVDPTNLINGVEVSTQQAYCIECDLQGTSGQTVNYDVALMLLSTSFFYNSSLISVPIAEVVVDPTVEIK